MHWSVVDGLTIGHPAEELESHIETKENNIARKRERERERERDYISFAMVSTKLSASDSAFNTIS